MTAPRRLTESYIAKLRYDNKPYVVRDTTVRGFMVGVNKCSKSYKVERDVRVPGKKEPSTIRLTLGRTDEPTLDVARTRAMEEIARLRKGELPTQYLPPVAETWTVVEMFEEYAGDLKARDKAARTIADARRMLDSYLADWKRLPIREITRRMARERHKRITRRHGKVVAIQALRVFGTAYNLALRIVDEPDALPPNPLEGVTFNEIRSDKKVLWPDELPGWWATIQSLPNPLRRNIHGFGILSGLRPGALVSLKRSWLRLDDRAISIPRGSMKSRRDFSLPLSKHMVGVVRQAINVGDITGFVAGQHFSRFSLGVPCGLSPWAKLDPSVGTGSSSMIVLSLF